MQTMIAIQDSYIAAVNGCHTGHVRRVRRAAWKKAAKALAAMGFGETAIEQIIRQARDIAELENMAEAA